MTKKLTETADLLELSLFLKVIAMSYCIHQDFSLELVAICKRGNLLDCFTHDGLAMAVSCFLKKQAVISREEYLSSRIYEFVCDNEGRQAKTKAFFFFVFYIGSYK